MYWILNADSSLRQVDVLEWGRWFETAERHIGDDTVGEAMVSTVFLGIDLAHGHCGPLLFETMIFSGDLHDSQWRYATLEEARNGHEHAVQLVRYSLAAGGQAAIEDWP